MLETTVAKAWLGINATGLQLAIASEGSFGPHALIPFLPSGIETLVFVDADQGWVIHEAIAIELTNFAHLVAVPGTPINTFLTQVGFPDHGLIVRPNAGDPFASLARGSSTVAIAMMRLLPPRPALRTAARASKLTCVRTSIRRVWTCWPGGRCGRPFAWQRTARPAPRPAGVESMSPGACLANCVACQRKRSRPRSSATQAAASVNRSRD